MNSTTNPILPAYSFTVGYLQGTITSGNLNIAAILKMKLKKAEMRRAIEAELRRLDAIVKEVDDPVAFHSKFAGAK